MASQVHVARPRQRSEHSLLGRGDTEENVRLLRGQNLIYKRGLELLPRKRDGLGQGVADGHETPEPGPLRGPYLTHAPHVRRWRIGNCDLIQEAALRLVLLPGDGVQRNPCEQTNGHNADFRGARTRQRVGQRAQQLRTQEARGRRDLSVQVGAGRGLLSQVANHEPGSECLCAEPRTPRST